LKEKYFYEVAYTAFRKSSCFLHTYSPPDVYFFDLPNMAKRTTMMATTIKIPTPTPVLKIPPITAQPEKIKDR